VPQPHTATQEWQSFELRMRHRRVQRCLVRANSALDAGVVEDAREALGEAERLAPRDPEVAALAARFAAVAQFRSEVPEQRDPTEVPAPPAIVDLPAAPIADQPIEPTPIEFPVRSAIAEVPAQPALAELPLTPQGEVVTAKAAVEDVPVLLAAEVPASPEIVDFPAARIADPPIEPTPIELPVRPALAEAPVQPALAEFPLKSQAEVVTAKSAVEEAPVLSAAVEVPRERSHTWWVAAAAVILMLAAAGRFWQQWDVHVTQPGAVVSSTAATAAPAESEPARGDAANPRPAVEPPPSAEPTASVETPASSTEVVTAPTIPTIRDTAGTVGDVEPALSNAVKDERTPDVVNTVATSAITDRPADPIQQPSLPPIGAPTAASPEPAASGATKSVDGLPASPAPLPEPVPAVLSSAPPAENAPLRAAVETPATNTPAAPAPAAVEITRVRSALDRYEAAYGKLDAGAAAAIWPSVDRAALRRAFDGLDSQSIDLGRCDIVVKGTSAQADCTGTARWTPKVGGGAHAAARRWRFNLANTGADWIIVSANVR